MWTPLADALPPEYEFVLCWLPNQPWGDRGPEEQYRAKFMFRASYVLTNTRGPSGWRWLDFGIGTVRPAEVSHWQSITAP